MTRPAAAPRHRARGLVPPVVLAAALALFVWLQATGVETTPRAAAERVWPVAVTAAEPVTVRPAVAAFGEVVASRQTALATAVDGTVAWVSERLVDGALVSRGEPLLRLDPFELRTRLAEQRAALREARARERELTAQAQAERALLAVARQELALRERQRERLSRLLAQGSASPQSAEEAALAASQARQAMLVRRQAVARLEAQATQAEAAVERAVASVHRAERALADSELTAPFTGHVGEVDVAVGRELRAGERVATLSAAAPLEVRFQLPGSDVARVLDSLAGDHPTAGGSAMIGHQAQVTWQLGQRRFRFRARIDRLAPRIDPRTGSLGFHAVLLDDVAHTPLRPGAFVRIEVPERLFRGVLRLPRSALADGDTIYVVEHGRAQPRTVRVLRSLGEELLVDADLPAGTPVITTRFPELRAGARVSVQ